MISVIMKAYIGQIQMLHVKSAMLKYCEGVGRKVEF